MNYFNIRYSLDPYYEILYIKSTILISLDANEYFTFPELYDPGLLDAIEECCQIL
jgi:hypothetical protein